MGESLRLGSFGGPTAIAVGDLDGDGKLDVALVHLAPHGFSCFLGNGDGSFGGPTFYSTGSTPKPMVAIGDLNGDTK